MKIRIDAGVCLAALILVSFSITGAWAEKDNIGVFREGYGWLLDSSGNGAFGLMTPSMDTVRQTLNR